MNYPKSVINVILVIQFASFHVTMATMLNGACTFDACSWVLDFCQNGGSCSLNETSCMSVCVCTAGFAGDRCETAVGEDAELLVSTSTPLTLSSEAKPASPSCAFNPCSTVEYCLNNGACSLEEITCTASCDCPIGFTGSRCQDSENITVTAPTTTANKVSQACAFNPCSSTFSICQNNGKCKLNNATCMFSCACPDGYTGSRCEILVNGGNVSTTTSKTTFCTFNACIGITEFCYNNGSCSVDKNTCIAKCACSSDYYGNRCEYQANTLKSTTKAPITETTRTCAFNPCSWSSLYCENGGECKLNKNTCLAFCTCSSGYTGDRCESIVGTGSTTPVPSTTSERICAFDICAWSSTYCNNGGTCALDKNTCMAKCLCPNGYSGPRCEERNVSTVLPTTEDPDGDREGTEGATWQTNATAVTTTESMNQAYNVCRGGALQRTAQERECSPASALPCVHGVCDVRLEKRGRNKWYAFKCECDPGAQGTFCELRCCLECGPHGKCSAHKAHVEDKNVTVGCECDHSWDGEFCDTYVPPPVRVEYAENTWYLWVVGVCVGTLFALLLLAVATPYWMWKHRVILIMKIVHYFQAYEDEDEREWDAFVSYKADETDERFVVQELYPKLEKELGFRLCLHFRDFVPGETISNNIINAVEGSRRTILILTPRYIKSEFTRFEYQKAQEEMLKRKHRIIPIVLEDISECKPVMDKNLKGIIGSVTYLEWPELDSDIKKDKFWKRLQLSMPKKKVSELVPSEKSCVSAQTNSTSVNSNIYSDGYEPDSQDVYMEIGEIDENISTVIRPLSEKEELEMINSSKYTSSKETVRSQEEVKSDVEKINNLKNINSNFKNNLILNMDELKLDLTDKVKTRDFNACDISKEGQSLAYSEYIV